MQRTAHITLAAVLLSGTLVLAGGVTEARGALTSRSSEPEIVALTHLASTLSDSRDAAPTTFSRRSVHPEAGLRVLSTATSVNVDVTHVYVQQTLGGIDVIGADASVAVVDGDVAYAPSRLLAIDNEQFSATSPGLDASQAAEAAAEALGVTPTSRFDVIEAPVGDDRSQTLAPAGIAREPIAARLLWTTVGKELRLAWELSIDMIDSSDWWSIHIDASTGDEIDRFNSTISDSFLPDEFRDNLVGSHSGSPSTQAPAAALRSAVSAAPGADGSSYDVFPMPVEAPSFAAPVGQRTVANEPADDIASPFGWHDTDGVLGAESTLTVGNNVSAYTDVDDDDVVDPGSQPDGGPLLDFTAPLDFTQDPNTNADAAVINLFYWNNVVHDVLSAHGFDEASGNFQSNNYGRGGLGGDAVHAQALDSNALAPTTLNRNNANFSVFADGLAPRMQMYRFTTPNPDRSASFDNGLVAHEYAHGLSERLTGGAATVACLRNEEQAGEGWSDFVALITTIEPGDAGTDRRGIGTYATGQPTNGDGIRARPYSTNFSIDERTYADIGSAYVPHGVGSVFAAMLWEMTWALIDVYGYDADPIRGQGGNNLALDLVIAGLKLQPCNPGFVDARDAILQADELLNSGDNTCTIWAAFARRGLGASASQGSPSSSSDGVEAFDLPTSCPLAINKSADVDSTVAGGTITYTIDVANRGADAATDVVVTDPIDPLASFVSGSATCAAVLDGAMLRLEFATIAPGADRSCSFAVSVDQFAPAAERLLLERFEPDASAWTISHDDRYADADWALSSVASRSPSHSMFGDDIKRTSDQYLTLTDPILIPSRAVMSFWHRFAFERLNGRAWDGGVVEISTDGGATWNDLGTAMTKNGYNTVIADFGGDDPNPLTGRAAFGGSSGGEFIETVVELDAYIGETVNLRFRLGTDASNGDEGWHLDDIAITTHPSVTNTATVSDGEGHIDTSTIVVDLPALAPIDPTTAPWRAVTPLRVLDTRVGGDGVGAIRPAGSTLPVAVLGRGGVPADAEAAVVNITSARAASDGFVTAYPCDAPRPEASSLNFVTGVNVGNEIIAAVDSRGDVCLFTSATTHLTVDVVGYVPAGSAYRPQTPVRLLDTRSGGVTIDRRFAGGGSIAAGTELVLDVAGRGGSPPSSNTAVINVTAIRGEDPGFVTVHPCLRRPPNASSLNFVPNTNRANELVAQLDDTGKVCLFVSAEVELAVDLVGTIPDGTDLVTVGPARLLDSRPAGSTVDAMFSGGGILPAGTETRLLVAGRSGVPTDAGIAVLNLTAVQTTSSGFVTVWPCSQPRPTASSLNHVAGVNGANELIVGLDTTGADAGHVCLYNDQATGLIVDVAAAVRPG